MKWSIKKLMVIGSLAVVYTIAVLGSSGITVATGIPGASGAINALVGAVMLALCCLLLKQFGSAAIMGFVYGILALPLPVLGMPGFIPKIAIATSAGIVADVIYGLFKKNEKIAAISLGAVTSVLIGFEVVGLGFLFSLPGIDKLAAIYISPIVIPITAILGGIGGFIGYVIYKKLEKTTVVRKIQA